MVQVERLVEEFMGLVQIDSESGNERAVCDCLKKKLSALGLEVVEDRSASVTGHNAGNLIATLKPYGKDMENIPGLFFTSHMDTVTPGKKIKPFIRDGYIVSDGTTVLGSDDKAGLAAILEAVRIIIEEKIEHGLIQLVFTIGEETGLVGSKNIEHSLIKADYGFAIDSNGPVGEIVNSAVAQKKIVAKIKGKAAHAGVNPEDGVSAVQIASRAISRMKLGRIDDETTANIGIIHGGTAINIVPEGVEVSAEVRSHSKRKLELYTEEIVENFKQAARELGGSVEVEVTQLYPAYHFSESDLVVRQAIEAIKKIGRKPVLRSSGGGSDANIFCSYGIPTINLGVGYENIHTTKERMPIIELRKAAEMIVSIIKEGVNVNQEEKQKELVHA